MDIEGLLETYAGRLSLTLDDYRSLLARTPTDALRQTDCWRDYERWFNDLTEIKNLRNPLKDKQFAKLTPDEQRAELTRLFYERVLPREHDKFLYFCLTYRQPTLIVRLPADSAEEKKFLGYEFSKRRGDEGIKLYQDAQGRHQTTLYDEETLHHPDKLNTLVWQVLSGHVPTIPDALQNYAKIVDLADCLDFTRVEFEKQIGLSGNSSQVTVFQSKYLQTNFQTVASLEYGSPLKESDRVAGEFPVVGSNGVVGSHNTFLIEGPAIVVGRKGSAGKVNWIAQNCTPIDTTFYVVVKPGEVNPRFLYFLMLELGLEQLGQGVGVPGLNRNDVHRLKIPSPPLPVQQQIVAEIESIEQQEAADKQIIQDSRAEIEQLVAEFSQSLPVRDVCELSKAKSEPNEIDDGLWYIGLENIESNTGSLTGREDAQAANLKSTKNVFAPGDVLYGKLRPYLNKVYLTEFAGVCSTDIIVLKTQQPVLLKHGLLHSSFVDQTSGMMKGINLPRLGVSDFLNCRVRYPDDGELESAVTTLETFDKYIREAEARLLGVAGQKAEVLKRHL